MVGRIEVIAGWLRLILSGCAVVFAILLVWNNRATVTVDYVWGTVDMPLAAVFLCGSFIGVIAYLMRVPLQRLLAAVFAELAARAAPKEAGAAPTVPAAPATSPAAPPAANGSVAPSAPVATNSAPPAAPEPQPSKLDPTLTSVNIAVGRFSKLWDRLKKGDPP